MYAVIHTGGKQYKVKKGDAVQVELLALELGATTTFSEVLFVGGNAGEAQIGQPYVASASVAAEVVAIEKGPKIIVYHKKRRKQSDKKTGHRQPHTRLLITGIDNGSGEKDLLSAEERKAVLGRVGFAQEDAWAVDDEDFDLADEQPKKSSLAKKVGLGKSAAPAAKKAAPAKKTVKK